jgi:plasmid stabilization system protein ParE
MSEFRLSPEAEAELDGIWIHITASAAVPRSLSAR